MVNWATQIWQNSMAFHAIDITNIAKWCMKCVIWGFHLAWCSNFDPFFRGVKNRLIFICVFHLSSLNLGEYRRFEGENNRFFIGEYQIFEVLKKYHKSYIDAKKCLEFIHFKRKWLESEWIGNCRVIYFWYFWTVFLKNY